MSKSKKKVLCIFCDRRRPRAVEDIIPNWLSEELDSTGMVTTEFTYASPGADRKSYSQQFGNLATLKLKRVCADCNNEWMSELEKRTRPLLEPLIHGRSSDIGSAAQRQIATWCQLKCLCLDAYYLETYEGVQHLPMSVFHEFGQSHQPLDSSTVALGRYIPPNAGTKIRWGRLIRSAPATNETLALVVVVSTFGLGHLAIQVTVGAWSDTHDRQANYSVYGPELLQTWPPASPLLSWPPRLVIKDDEFESAAQPMVAVTQLEVIPLEHT